MTDRNQTHDSGADNTGRQGDHAEQPAGDRPHQGGQQPTRDADHATDHGTADHARDEAAGTKPEK